MGIVWKNMTASTEFPLTFVPGSTRCSSALCLFFILYVLMLCVFEISHLNIHRPDVTLTSKSEVKVHPILNKLFKEDFVEKFTFTPDTVPMLVPPVPWTNKELGGLLLHTRKLLALCRVAKYIFFYH